MQNRQQEKSVSAENNGNSCWIIKEKENTSIFYKPDTVLSNKLYVYIWSSIDIILILIKCNDIHNTHFIIIKCDEADRSVL